jgi:hypothetical protein
LISHKTLAEIDKGFANDKQFEAAMGEDGMKKFGDLYAGVRIFAASIICVQPTPELRARGMDQGRSLLLEAQTDCYFCEGICR